MTKGQNKQFNKRTTKRREKDDDAPRGKMMGKYTRYGYGSSAGVGKKHGKQVDESKNSVDDILKSWSSEKRLPKAPEKFATIKGFHIKRDRPTKKGTGFTMMIRPKIKGFEEGTDMSKQEINEVEGVKTVSTKGYHGSKPQNPKYRPSTKGFINFKAGKPESEDDEKVLNWHKSEAAKVGKVVQLRYRGPRSHEGRHTYNPAASQTRGAATGAAIYYKSKDELGGRQRAAAWKRNKKDPSTSGVREEYEMENGEYEIEYINEDENEQEEIMEPNVSDLVVHAVGQKPLEFQQTFADLMQQRIADSVYDKKLEIASTFVDPNQYMAGDEGEYEDESEQEYEEEPEEYQDEGEEDGAASA